MSYLKKQKINDRSSVEDKLIGVNNTMNNILWAPYFIKGQGYLVEQKFIYQDNMSSILLKRNDRLTCSKQTKHINNRYFFIMDRI